MQYKIIVDKQPSSNPSNEKKEYTIDIEELRVKGNVYDSLNIEKDRTYVTRRLSLSEYGVLTVLDEPVIQELSDIDIKLFEGDNYIYLLDMQGNKFYAEYIIKNDFTDLYVTTNQMNSAITQSADKIELSVNQKLTSYATTDDLEEQVTELNSTITQTASEINAEVEKKVDEETITGAYLILKINGDTSEAKLNADKIELSANDVLNLLAGNTINLTGKNIAISSTNFNVDKNGNMTCNNANVTGGLIRLTGNYAGSSSGSNFIIDNNTYTNLKLFSNRVSLSNDTADISCSMIAGDYHSGVSTSIGCNGINPQNFVSMSIEDEEGTAHIDCSSSNNYTAISPSGITTPKVTQTSIKSKKKNIKKLKIDALELIKNADICEYNFKSEKKGTKKHIGLVIGEGYNCPEQIISEDGQGIEQYSYTSLVTRALQQYIQQQDKLISDLTKRLEKLEKEACHGKDTV